MAGRGERAEAVLEAQRGTFLLWAPVALGTGAGVYFLLPIEPAPGLVALCAALVAAAALGVLVARRSHYLVAILAGAVALTLAGFLDAALSARRAAAPVLEHPLYGPVAGRVVTVDRSRGGLARVTLDRVLIGGVAPGRTPTRVRVSLAPGQVFAPLEPGRHLALTARLSPPPGPVEPGGFDFRRYAWFRHLGAIGYSRSPVVEYAPPEKTGFWMRLNGARRGLAKRIRSDVGGEAGAVAAAVLTGDRSAISPATIEALRDSNLAHLLAISGLHMGLLSGFVYAAIRYGFALVPFLALRLPVERIAAVVAFFAATTYLLLSGANVATQRAFVMVAVLLLAVVLERRAFTLRAVALAAVIILVLRPQSVVEAGFQMSFAATVALVAGFGALRDLGWPPSGGGRARRIAYRVLALVLASAVAGGATAPIAAAHFNRIAEFGLIANLASVPVMGFVVIPAGVLAALCTPVGLGAPFWTLMGWGLDWILAVAARIAALDGAVLGVVKPHPAVLPLFAGGALAVILLRTRLRLAGLAPIMAALLLWSQSERPAILVAPEGRLVGVMRADKRWLSTPRGSSFAARVWLENDGDRAGQIAAAARWPQAAAKDMLAVGADTNKVLISETRKPDAAAIGRWCAQAAVLVLPRWKGRSDACHVISAADLARSGAVAIRFGGEGVTVETARDAAGERLWTTAAKVVKVQ